MTAFRAALLLAALAALAGCDRPSDDAWLGYVEAEYTYVAPLEAEAWGKTQGVVVDPMREMAIRDFRAAARQIVQRSDRPRLAPLHRPRIG